MEKVTEATLHLEKVTEATLQFRIPKSNLSLNYSQKIFWLDWTIELRLQSDKKIENAVDFE